MLALADAAIVEAPQLRALALGLPLAELVAEGEDALLRARALLVAAGAAEGRVEAVLGDRIEQRDRLQPVARGARARSARPRARCRIESSTEATISRSPSSATRRSRNSIASGKLCPVSTCISGNGNGAGRNAFSASRSSTIESLPPLNSSTGRSNSAADLAHHVDRLGLERAQVGKVVGGVASVLAGVVSLAIVATRHS